MSQLHNCFKLQAKSINKLHKNCDTGLNDYTKIWLWYKELIGYKLQLQILPFDLQALKESHIVPQNSHVLLVRDPQPHEVLMLHTSYVTNLLPTLTFEESLVLEHVEAEQPAVD